MFTTPFPDAFGIDISDLSIKIVQLKNSSFRHHKPNYELITARSIQLPYGIIVDGEIQEPESVRKYILHLLKGIPQKTKPITAPWAIASIPEKQSFIKLITIPKKVEEIIDDDVRIAAKKHIPFEEATYYMDWQIVSFKESPQPNTTILLAVTTKHIANLYTYLLESVGLGVVALEVESLAMARSMVTAQKLYAGEARAILDIGASKTTFIIYDNESVQFSRVLRYSGGIVSTALEQKLHITHEKAETIKKSMGLEYKKKDKKVWPILLKTTDILLQDIKRSIQFYYSHFPQANKITYITLSGGGSKLKKLPEVLTAKLSIPTGYGNAWKNLSPKKKKKLDPSGGRSYSVAIGLALRAADNPFIEYDMI
jgi:type IV pilus assembly protein PilM